MKLARLEYDSASALGFFEDSLSALGALCERTWHDRLEIVAEGRPAKIWNDDGVLHAQELVFAPADAGSARDAGREVFPGCPLTFRLAELLRPSPLVLEKVVLRDPTHARPPEQATLEKIWRSQFPVTYQWRMTRDPKSSFHFSLVGLVRCDIQAIDQHWSLHRIALSLPHGQPDEALARQLLVLEVDAQNTEVVSWPRLAFGQLWPMLGKVIEAELTPEIDPIRARQAQYLEREINRIDDYFAQYEQELRKRGSRSGTAAAVKTDQRLAAARAEHARRRVDQVARHEIRVAPCVDALLLVAEPAWETIIETTEQRTLRTTTAAFVPRLRRWFPENNSLL
jgi:hypothetical protein